MVMGTDPPLVDVAIIVEDTALGGAHMQDLRTSYIQPTLEHFNGGVSSDLDFSSIDCSSSFSLIPFHASDCLPKPSAKVIGPFTSIKRILNVFDKLEFTGGMGESYSSGHEGIASALQAFEDVKKMRGNPDLAVSQHMVFISNSPTYDIPVLENYKFNGMSLDQLAATIKDNNISLSIISQRKIPFLYKLFEKCGGDLKQAQEKNYAKDPRHLVLLRGYSLQERPLTPKPPPATSPNIPNVAAVPGYPADPRSKTPNQPLQVPSSQPDIKQEINPTQQPNINMTRPMVATNMMAGRLPNQAAMNQGPNAGLQGTINQPQSQFPGMRQPVPQSLIRPGGQQPQQQPGGMPKAMVPGGPQPGQTGPNLLRQALNDKIVRGNQQGVSQQPGMPNPTLKQLLGTPGTQSNATMPNLVGQLNRPLPAPMQPGMGPGQMVPGGMGVQPGMPIAQPGTREREVIWKGELEWQEKLKEGPADQKISHSVNCTVSTSKENGVPEVKPDNWPAKLIMQLIPKSLVQTIGGQYFRNSKSVLFHPNECESLDALTKVMGTGFAGCVHFTGVQACDIKVLILLYSNDKKAYLGFIPDDQASFVDRIRTVIQQQKTGQQVRAQGQIGGAQMVAGQQMGVGQQMGGQQHMGQMGGGQMGQMGMQQGQVVTQGQMMGQQGQMMGQGGMRMSQPGIPGQQSMMGQQQPGMMMGGGNSVMISQGQSMPSMSVGQSIVSTEDMFTYNVEVESEQTTSVVGMDGDDTNNNTTIQPRINNVMEEIQDTNKDLEVLEEINMDNSMKNAQRNLNTKPVLKECEVRINRISRTSFGMMRNCCVKIKRLDRKFDKALKYLKSNDNITQELLRETRSNPKQRLSPSQSSRGDVGSCVPQASSSGAPTQRDLHKQIDGINTQERSHPNVILRSANCDEFFSSSGGQAHSTSEGEETPNHAHSTDDCQDAPIHAHSTDDCQDTSNHAHSIDDCQDAPIHAHYTDDCQDTSNHAHSAADLKATPSHAHYTSDGDETPSHAHSTSDGEATPSHAHSTDDCQDTSNHALSAADLKATPSHAHSTSDGEATPIHHAQPSTHFSSPIKVPNRSNPPQFDGHMSEMDDVNTEEEEINTNRRAFDCIANNAKTVPKTSSSERICLLTELANTDDVNTDGSDLDRDNMEIDTNATIERSHEDDPMCPTEIIANISSLNEKHKNKIVPKTSSSKSDIMDVIDERAPGDIRIYPTKLSNNFSSNEYQQSKTILKMSSPDKIYFRKESLKNSKENVDYGTLDLDFENQERDLFDIIEDRAFKGKPIPSASKVSRNSLPQENRRPVEKEIFMEVDNGDFENGQNIHDGRLTSILPSEFDTEVASVSTPSLLGCSKSSKNHVELSNDEEDVEKQIELVPKIKIKRNLIQWAFEFDSDSFLTPPRKTSKRLNVSSDDDIENQMEESPKKTAKTKSKPWKPYSKEEDNNIVRYMKENSMTGRQRGRRNWRIMEEENVCPGRTWQSMKERWIKHIERKLINISSGDEDQ